VFQDLSVEKREAIISFSDGVTQYMEQHIHTLPLEFAVLGYNPEPWEPQHTLNIIGYMAWDLAGVAYSAEILLHQIIEILGPEQSACLMPRMEEREEVVYPRFKLDGDMADADQWLLREQSRLDALGIRIFSGSNNWVVSGEKSETGKPLFANDMHLGLDVPGIWYQMHQVVRDTLNVTGISVPGAPWIIAGHNEDIAWGLTNMYVDDIDLYLETINPDNPDQYRLDGEWKSLDVHQETIHIKGGDSIIVKNKFTHRGPIISDFKSLDQAISMRWIGNDYSNEARSVYLLNRARNWDDFKNALKTFNAISQNFAYADVEGNIGLYAGGGIPIRKGPAYLVQPGDTSAYDWQGRVPFEQLPHSYNPESGYVASANNKTVGNEYPYYIGSYFSEGYRMRRITDLLESKEKLSLEDFKDMQADQVSYMAKSWLPQMLEVMQSAELNDLEKSGLDILKSWDLVYSASAAAPLIFEKFYFQMTENLLVDELGTDLFNRYASNGKLPRQFMDHFRRHHCPEIIDDVRTDDVTESFQDIVKKSFSDAMAALESEMGDRPEKWQWGKVHQLTLAHPVGQVKIMDLLFDLNRGPYPVGGSSHTVSPFAYGYADRFSVSFGSSHRHIYSVADWDDGLVIIPTGASGVPASNHYCDQTGLYLDHKYHTGLFSEESVIENARYESTFIPFTGSR
jgi:penicillin amidase